MYTLAVTGVQHGTFCRGLHVIYMSYVQAKTESCIRMVHCTTLKAWRLFQCGDHAHQELTQVKRKGWSVVELVLFHSDDDGRCH